MKDIREKRQVDIDGHKLTYAVSGSGQPAIVLINGLGVPLGAWSKLYPEIDKLGTVVAYDRPGVGKSSRPQAAQTAAAAVQMLRCMLSKIGIGGPYILVGHSIGGLYANLFARLYPEDVAGVMMLEATAPEDVGSLELHQTRVARVINAVFDLFTRHQPNHERNNITESVTQLSAHRRFRRYLSVSSPAKKHCRPGWCHRRQSACAPKIRQHSHSYPPGVGRSSRPQAAIIHSYPNRSLLPTGSRNWCRLQLNKFHREIYHDHVAHDSR